MFMLIIKVDRFLYKYSHFSLQYNSDLGKLVSDRLCCFFCLSDPAIDGAQVWFLKEEHTISESWDMLISFSKDMIR